MWINKAFSVNRDNHGYPRFWIKNKKNYKQNFITKITKKLIQKYV